MCGEDDFPRVPDAFGDVDSVPLPWKKTGPMASVRWRHRNLSRAFEQLDLTA